MRLTEAAGCAGVVVFASLCLTACPGPSANGTTSSSEAETSGAASVAGTSGTSSGQQTAAGSGTASGGTGIGSGTSGGSSTGNSISGTIGGTSTGASPPVFVDGGYVSCFLPSAVDAGANGDGGPTYWNCSPGTYFCNPAGLIGSCFQCRSDADCADRNLPTYDPRKAHCDPDSGALGFQGFCQECIGDADCAGNPNGNFCDQHVYFEEPPIVTLGFDTCNREVTDCRLDGGPSCGRTDQSCDAQTGQCVFKIGACQSDDDCAGYLSPSNPNVLEPYCSDAGFCSSCPGGGCPNGYCGADSSCGGKQVCDAFTDTCSCSDDSQCGGVWPSCVDRDGSRVDDAGQPLGYCGCDSNAECGDAGLICLAAPIGPAFCGVSCSSPGFPSSCELATGSPVCDPQNGLCGPCVNDNQCRDANDPAGPRCDHALGGSGGCGCLVDQDCPAGEICPPAGNELGTCAPALPRCTPESCNSGFCDWKTGSCTESLGIPCVDDFGCSTNLSTANSSPVCLLGPGFGSCVGCLSNADCVNSPAAAFGATFCCLPGVALCDQHGYASNSCEVACVTDADCLGNVAGSGCIIVDAGVSNYCGCVSDADCSGHIFGHHCDLDPIPGDYFLGFCGCVTDGDCAPGQACQISEGETIGLCALACTSLDGGECAPGYFCDPAGACRPRCDGTNQCQGTTVCDSQNAANQNGEMVGIDAPGVTWCYACVSPSDCPAGEGCEPTLGCGPCSSDASCPAGTVCISGGICQPTCADGPCPAGEVCDVHGLVGARPDICYQCLSPADCPEPEGCNSQTHTCGTCVGPTASVYSRNDCPPDAVCSNYWSGSAPGVCLANCDRTPCPAGEPICAVYPGLTPDHSYCFGCLQDSDCGPNQRCNLSPHPTFTCVDAR